MFVLFFVLFVNAYVTVSGITGEFIFPDGTNTTEFNLTTMFPEPGVFVLENFIFTDSFVKYIGYCSNINKIFIRNNRFVHTVPSNEDSSLEIDMSCDLNSELTIENNVFVAQNSCINGSLCVDNGIYLKSIHTTSKIVKLYISGNSYEDEFYGGSLSQENKDANMYKNGLYIDSTSFIFLETLLDFSMPLYDIGSVEFQRIPQNLKTFNPTIVGMEYDIKICYTPTCSVVNCQDTCRGWSCDRCFVDPTRYNINLTDACYFITHFDYLGDAG